MSKYSGTYLHNKVKEKKGGPVLANDGVSQFSRKLS